MQNWSPRPPSLPFNRGLGEEEALEASSVKEPAGISGAGPAQKCKGLGPSGDAIKILDNTTKLQHLIDDVMNTFSVCDVSCQV